MAEVLKTERLVLRPLRWSDAAAIAEKINNFDISKNLARVPYPYTLADAEEFLNWVFELDNRSAFYVIALREQPDELLGVISYDWVPDKSRAELGYWLVQQQWGKGLMTEAARAVVEHAFTVSGLEQLSSCYFVENPASGKVLAKAGFTPTGKCTSPSRSRGEDVDVVTMGLMREDWANKKAAV